MKAYLMHRNRDFDPQQLLVRRDKELRYHRGNEQGLELQQLLPWNEAALRQDLGLDIVFNAMAAGDRFLFEVAQVDAIEPHRSRCNPISSKCLCGLRSELADRQGHVSDCH